MDLPQVDGQGRLGGHRPGRGADVQGVTAQQLDDLARPHRGDRTQVPVPPVVQHVAEPVHDLVPVRSRRHVRAAGAGDVHAADRPATRGQCRQRGRGRSRGGLLDQAAGACGTRMHETHRGLPWPCVPGARGDPADGARPGVRRATPEAAGNRVGRRGGGARLRHPLREGPRSSRSSAENAAATGAEEGARLRPHRRGLTRGTRPRRAAARLGRRGRRSPARPASRRAVRRRAGLPRR